MKIVFQHLHPLPVIKYGGIERILFWHMVELSRLGHEVVLIGHPNSQVQNHGIKLIPIDQNNAASWESLIPKDTDIVHLFYAGTVKNFPTICTIQCNGQIGEKYPLHSVFVSKVHAENHGSDIYIYNALDLNEYPFIEVNKSWDNFLFLAKASWRIKNLKHSVMACRKNNKHLNVVGGRWLGISRYIHNHGMLGGIEKMKIIQNSDALLFPVRWHEPFGIAIIEAMSQGLPVIGSSFGSLPELITTETGFISKNYSEFLDAVKSSPQKYNSLKIRKYVEDNFNINIHALKYIDIYKRILNGEKLNIKNPTYRFSERAENLLPF